MKPRGNTNLLLEISNDTLTDRIGQERGRMIDELTVVALVNRGKCKSERWCRYSKCLFAKTRSPPLGNHGKSCISPKKTICCSRCTDESPLTVSKIFLARKNGGGFSIFEGRWVSASQRHFQQRLTNSRHLPQAHARARFLRFYRQTGPRRSRRRRWGRDPALKMPDKGERGDGPWW